MAAIRRVAGVGFGLPAPRLVTTVGAWLLGSDPALPLTGRRCVPTRLVDHGFEPSTMSFESAAAEALAMR